MVLKKGDKVKFLNDVGGGELVSFLDKTKAIVRTPDGFEIPVKLSDLVADSGNFMVSEKPEQQEAPASQVEIKSAPVNEKPKEAESIINKEEELSLAIIPKQNSSDLFAYMVNNTSYNIHYVITKKGEDETLLFDQGSMDARTQMKIKKFLPENLNNSIRFDIQVLFFKEDFFTPRDPASISFFMNPSEVYSGKGMTENDYFDQKAMIFTISDFNKKTSLSRSGGIDASKLLREKISNETAFKVSPPAKKAKTEPEEVDLHIEAITDSHAGLSNSEIIDMQMARFKIALDTAVIHKTRRIVFIHGVGNGKLKFTLRKALDHQYPDLQYQDASFKEYGYGATMVIIP